MRQIKVQGKIIRAEGAIQIQSIRKWKKIFKKQHDHKSVEIKSRHHFVFLPNDFLIMLTCPLSRFQNTLRTTGDIQDCSDVLKIINIETNGILDHKTYNLVNYCTVDKFSCLGLCWGWGSWIRLELTVQTVMYMILNRNL